MNIKRFLLPLLLAGFVQSANATATLLGFYALDGNGNEATGLGPNLTTPSGAVSYASGASGQAASFNGSGTSWLRANIDASGNTNPTFSWGAWVKLNDPSAWNIFISNDNGGWDRFTQANGGFWSVSNGGGVQRSSAATSSAWTFVAETFDGTTQKLFVDGVQVLSAADGPHDSYHYIEIGRNANGAYPLNGLIDSVFFFDNTLTSTDIATIYNGGAGGAGVLDVAGLSSQAPEPAGFALFGLAGLALARRRRKDQS